MTDDPRLWHEVSKLRRRVRWAEYGAMATIGISLASLGLSLFSVTSSSDAAEEARHGRECGFASAQFDRFGETQATAERVLAGGLSTGEALQARVQLSVARAEFRELAKARGCLPTHEESRLKTTLDMADDALEALHGTLAALAKPSPSPS